MPKCDFHVDAKQRATSKTWTRTLDPDPEKPEPLKTWTLKTWTQKNLNSKKHGPKKISTLKNMNPGKHGVNMGGIKKYV